MFDDNEIAKLARLARLRLRPDEIERLGEHLRRVVDFVGRLEEVDVDGVPAMAHPLSDSGRLRDDEPRPSLTTPDALAAAPDVEATSFRVPRTVKR